MKGKLQLLCKNPCLHHNTSPQTAAEDPNSKELQPNLLCLDQNHCETPLDNQDEERKIFSTACCRKLWQKEYLPSIAMYRASEKRRYILQLSRRNYHTPPGDKVGQGIFRKASELN